MMDALNGDQIQELREHFNILDLNGSGWIEESDLKEAMAHLGTPKDDYEVKKLLQSIDTNSDGRLSFEEYVAWNSQLFVNDMKMKFKQLDEDGNGSIGKVELKAFAMELGYGVTEEELDQLTYEMDTDQDNKIGIEEFVCAMVGIRHRAANE
jgi:calcium-binding protein CML